MVLHPSFSRKMGEIETVETEKMGWLDLPRGTSYPTFPYISSADYFFSFLLGQNEKNTFSGF